MNRTQIKICGVTNLEDAKACAELGADMIGLNFYSLSPRAIEGTNARRIVEAMSPDLEVVGVFVDANADEIRTRARAAGLTAVQLHGKALPGLCRRLAREFRVIRALQTHHAFQPKTAMFFQDCDVLLDAYHPELRGGTGQTCDWSIAHKTLAFARFLFLSGGLNSQNIERALETVRPHGVDVCSGVETAPGVKDRNKVKEFIKTVRLNSR